MASLDVVDPEPLPAGHPLYRHPGVRLSPHISWSSPRTVARTFELFVDNLARYRAGRRCSGWSTWRRATDGSRRPRAVLGHPAPRHPLRRAVGGGVGRRLRRHLAVGAGLRRGPGRRAQRRRHADHARRPRPGGGRDRPGLVVAARARRRCTSRPRSTPRTSSGSARTSCSPWPTPSGPVRSTPSTSSVGTGTSTRAAEAFAGLCRRAAEHGLLVHIEWLPWSRIPDLATALEIVRAAGQPNGGLNVDAWHFVRTGTDLDELRQVPGRADPRRSSSTTGRPEAEPDLIDATLHDRSCPGDGGFDLSAYSCRRWRTPAPTAPDRGRGVLRRAPRLGRPRPARRRRRPRPDATRGRSWRRTDEPRRGRDRHRVRLRDPCAGPARRRLRGRGPGGARPGQDRRAGPALRHPARAHLGATRRWSSTAWTR